MYKSLNDVFNFISKLSLLKIINFVQLLFSYYYSRIKRKSCHKGMPFSVSIEPTTSCNLQCPECPSGLRSFNRPTGMLSYENFINIIDQLKKKLIYLNLYFQGEPFLNKDFCKMVKYASDAKIYTSTSSNAHFINKKLAEEIVKSGLDRIIISIDGVSNETYIKYRKGGNLNKVLDGTVNLINAKKQLRSSTPFIIWQFIVFKHNEHEIETIKKMAKNYNVNRLNIKTAQIYNTNNTNFELIPQNTKYSRYEKGNEIIIKNNLMNHCWRMWQGCIITWDGDVCPCCFDKDANYKLGNVVNNSFELIWKNEKYNQFRNSILKSRKNIDICSNCSEGTKIWI